MLNIQNYTKRFGDKIAVDDLSLHIAAGEICAFIGHNGAGKTTTLKACCGLLKPDGGTITVNGIDIQKDPIACKKIMAYIPDNPDLYEFLTGYEYLNFVADMYGVSEADRKARMEALAERLDIKNALPNLISECSHGMKKKIAVIGALSMQGLTSRDPEECKALLHMLKTTDDGKGFMHEGFHKDDPSKFTRPWFAWSNSLFSEFVLKCIDENIL